MGALPPLLNESLSESGTMSHYLRAIYWSTMTLTTTGHDPHHGRLHDHHPPHTPTKLKETKKIKVW